MGVRQRTNNLKHDYVNVYHREFDSSRPEMFDSGKNEDKSVDTTKVIQI